ncbi:987_t:CDS:2 [Acaulospora colombiana]|uniref:987_t:CDS:1 n=1 Tax=Acaulospora colombiana TaxID=27376 RepID=A0ACA9MNR8_9GLOM|nr:987_t:CDS:2 [Acaulospora colombiana]
MPPSFSLKSTYALLPTGARGVALRHNASSEKATKVAKSNC